VALTATARGTGAAAAATTINITPATNIAAGSLAVVTLAYDNSASGGSDPYSSISGGPSGGTATLRQSRLYDPGTPSQGLVVRTWTITCPSGWNNGTNFTVSLSSSAVHAWAICEIVPGSGYEAGYSNGAINTGSASSAPTITSASLTSGDCIVGFGGAEYSNTWVGDSDTSNGSWSSAQTAGYGTTTAGQSVIHQCKVVTGTATQTFNPTLTSADQIIGWVSLREAAAARTMTAASTLTGVVSAEASLTNTAPAAVTMTAASTLTGVVAAEATLTNTPPAGDTTMTAASTLTGTVSASADLTNTPPAVTVAAASTLSGVVSAEATLVNTPPAVTLTAASTLTGVLAAAASLTNTPPAVTIEAASTLTGIVSAAASLTNTPPAAVTMTAASTLTGIVSASASLTNTPPAAVTMTAGSTLTGTVSASADLTVSAAGSTTITAASTLTGTVSAAATITNTAPSAVTLAAASTLSGVVSASASLTTAAPSAVTMTGASTLTGVVAASASITTGTTGPVTIAAASTLTGTLSATATLSVSYDALYFDGIDDSVALGDLGLVEDGAFAFEAVLRMPEAAPSVDRYLFAEYGATARVGIALLAADAGKLRFVFRDDAGGTCDILSPASVCDGSDHYLAVEAGGGYGRLYLDGVLVTGPVALPAGTVSTTAATLGSRGAADYWYGGVYVARAYPDPLGAAAIAAQYDAWLEWCEYAANVDLIATLCASGWRTRLHPEGFKATTAAEGWRARLTREGWKATTAAEGWRATTRRS